MKTTTPTKAKKLPAAPAKKMVVSKPKSIAKAAAPKPTEVKVKPTVKPKLVRDSFTIPKDEYLVLSDLKARMTKLMQPAKKSELLRAGLKVLATLSDAGIKKALLAVPSIKTGRPAHSKK
jgi:hypothetical protein